MHGSKCIAFFAEFNKGTGLKSNLDDISSLVIEPPRTETAMENQKVGMGILREHPNYKTFSYNKIEPRFYISGCSNVIMLFYCNIAFISIDFRQCWPNSIRAYTTTDINKFVGILWQQP